LKEERTVEIEQEFVSNENLKKETHEILEEIEIEDLTVDGICGVY
jgi:mycofactocin precursor